MNASFSSSITGQKKPFGSRPLFRALVLAVVIVLAAFYPFENWRGNRSWNKYRQRVEAKGVSLKAAVPSQWAVQSSKDRQTPYEKELDEVGRGIELAASLVSAAGAGSPDRQFVDLVAWKQAFALIKSGHTNENETTQLITSGNLKIETGTTNPLARAEAAAAVLDAFAVQDALLEKLRSACRRPQLLYPFGYEGTKDFGPVPRIFGAINLCRQLRVRTSAELAGGKTTDALRNLDLMLCVSDSLRREPFLIGGIGSVACRTIALKSPWEGLAERRFTAPELQQLEQLLRSVDLIADIPLVLRYERADVLRLFDQVQETRNFEHYITGPGYGPLKEQLKYKAFIFACRSMPDGWIQLDKLNYSKWMDEMIAAGFTDPAKRIQPIALDQACGNVQRQVRQGQKFNGLLRHTVISAVCTSRVNEWALSATAAQVTADQTRLACGLELYFLKHGSYPEKLEQIVPEFLATLPADPISGGAYGYMRDENGRYKLWSVGWDEKDEGGVPDQGHYDKTADWVWRYPGS